MNENSGSQVQELAAAGSPGSAAGSPGWSGIRTNLAAMEKQLDELQGQVDPTRRRVEPAEFEAPHAGHGQVGHPGHAEIVQVKQQIEDLLRVREMLRASLRSAIGACERSLGQLERGEPLAHPSELPSPVSSPVAPAPPAAIADGISLRPSVFQGNVSLRVGPLNDISQVDSLEIALLQLPGTEQVEIKEFAGRDAVAEIRLFQPVRLVEELHRVLPFSFEVAHGDAGTLTLVAGR